MGLQPRSHLLPKRVRFRPEIVFRKLVSSIENEGRELLARSSGSPVPQHVLMHALEVTRQLMIFGISDRAERVLNLESRLSQRRTGEPARSGRKDPPCLHPLLLISRGVLQLEADAEQGDATVRQFVLNGLEFADRSSEL